LLDERNTKCIPKGMSDICPCCGAIIAGADLKVSMDFNTVICGSTALEVTPKECEIIFVLWKCWPHGIPQERLIQRVWGHEGHAESGVWNIVYNARKKLNTIGYTIRAIRNRGYRLERLGAMSRK
jgi:DNA-binding winged helix-turn-helix (wHTH) protein